MLKNYLSAISLQDDGSEQNVTTFMRSLKKHKIKQPDERELMFTETENVAGGGFSMTQLHVCDANIPANASLKGLLKEPA